MGKRFLFVSWDGGGNVVPILQVMRKLAAAGHAAGLLGNESLRERTQDAGATFFPYKDYGTHDPTTPQTDMVKPWQGTGPSDVAELVRQRMMFGPALSIAKDVIDTAAEFQAGMIAIDYVMFGGFVGAEAAGKPWAVMIPHGYPFPHAGSRGRGPFTYLFPRTIAPGLDSLNRARAALLLPALNSVMEQFQRASGVMLTTYKAFDAPGPEVLSQAAYVGSQLDLSPSPPLANSSAPPLVLVSLSTAYQAQESVLVNIIAALSSLPVRGLVLTGDASDKRHFQSTANVEVKAYVPHAMVLPKVSLVITHAGHGTVMGALEHGIPLLCLPCTMDQFDNAYRVAELGAGVNLASSSPQERIKEAIQQLLSTPKFREKALELCQSIRAERDPRAAVNQLERLCS